MTRRGKSKLIAGVAALLIAAPAEDAAGQGIRIFGVNYPEGTQRAEDGVLWEVPVAVTSDQQYGRFPLTVSVRNGGPTDARYQLHLKLERMGRVARSAMLDVAKGTVRRERYDVTIDFFETSEEPSGSGTSLAAPTSIRILPSNPVRATLRLLSESGAVVDSQALNLNLHVSPPPFRYQTDLSVERVEFMYVRPQMVVERAMYAKVVFRNMGRETWGFRGEVSAHLQHGTPATRLYNIGSEGMPLMPSRPLPAGIEVNELDSVTIKLEARFTSTGPIGGGRLIRTVPPLRAGQWYTLTGSTASEADLNPRNDALRLIFMLNDDMTIRESRTERFTGRVRTITR